MTSWLVDTNVISELRKGDRAAPRVRSWLADQPAGELFLSVLTIAELRRGIGSVGRRDRDQAALLSRWSRELIDASSGRILEVDVAVAEVWAELMVPDPRPVIDALIAATAIVHGLTVATRNVADFEPMGVEVFNPFAA